jgi:para-nitrobenzyl esterase
MKYWTNFAKRGDPNEDGLPFWREFSENNSVVMYLNYTQGPGPVPNLVKLKLMEEYFTYQREKSD